MRPSSGPPARRSSDLRLRTSPMTFRPGATLGTGPTLGFADTADVGPTAGNGFFTRWPDDLAALQDHGITDVRLTFDWARLQPRPGVFDDRWSEFYESVVAGADAIGLRVWATMHDASIPRWFDNEGGIDDDDAVTAWWPRYVERIAERFGDRIGGWVPFAVMPAGAPDRPWEDTWGILGGGPPVAIAVGGDDLARVERLAGRYDLVGIEMVPDLDDGDEPPTDHYLTELAERWGETVRDAVGTANTPAVVTVRPGHTDADIGGRVVESAVDAVGWAIDDGGEVEVVFGDPGIAGPDDPAALFDLDRAPLSAADALVSRDES